MKFPRGEELWSNVRAALRVAGTTPPRAVVTTTPPRQLDWILDLAIESTTRVTRGRMAVGEADGHLKLEPFDWASRAVQIAERHAAGRYVVEPTGSGSYPRATLTAQLGMMHARRLPIVDSKAKGSKSDRAAPLSAACAGGRLHVVGRQEVLERDLTTWHPRANWSPAGLDALVHGASFLTNEWKL